MPTNDKYDTEAQTILHYAKKIREYCYQYKRCSDCPFWDVDNCYFETWLHDCKEVNLHE